MQMNVQIYAHTTKTREVQRHPKSVHSAVSEEGQDLGGADASYGRNSVQAMRSEPADSVTAVTSHAADRAQHQASIGCNERWERTRAGLVSESWMRPCRSARPPGWSRPCCGTSACASPVTRCSSPGSTCEVMHESEPKHTLKLLIFELGRGQQPSPGRCPAPCRCRGLISAE